MADIQKQMEEGDFAGVCEALRAGPSTPESMLMLFGCEIRCGEFERALQTVAALKRQAPQLSQALDHFTGLTRCEQARAARAKDPAEAGKAGTLGTPSPTMLELVRVRTLLVSGQLAEADEGMAGVRAAAPKCPGVAVFADGKRQPFSNLWDSDDLTGPSLQVFVDDGSLLDLAFEAIRRVVFLPRKSSYDFIWCPVEFSLHDGTTGTVAIPALYEGSGRHASSQARTGQMTLWAQKGKIAIGSGQRDFKLFSDGGGAALVGIYNLAELTFEPRGAAGRAPSKQGFWKRLLN